MLLAVLPTGPEFLVNTSTNWDQNDAAVAMKPDGGFVVAWEGQGDGGNDNIYFQRFSAQEAPLGPQTRANSTTKGNQRDPAVAMDAEGNFIIAWEDDEGTDGSGDGVFARRFDSAGEALGDEFLVNTTTSGMQNDVAVAMAPDGRFVITWKSDVPDYRDRIFAQRYDAMGERAGDEWVVSPLAPRSAHADPSIAIHPSGDFVITWQRIGREIVAQRYNAQGQAQGELISVRQTDPLVSAWTLMPVVAMDGTGGFVIAWSEAKSEVNSVSYAIAARRYLGSGEAVADAFTVSESVDPLNDPAIAMDAQGAFVIAWEDRDPASRYYHISARRYEPASSVGGPTFPVSDYSTEEQNKPTIGMASAGQFVIAWESEWQDGSFDSVRARRYAPVAISTPASVSGIVWDDANRNGIRDSREAGVDGIPVLLYDANDDILAEGVTSNGGRYRVDSIPPNAVYSLRFVTRPDEVLTLKGQGDPSLSSDADPLTGRIERFALSSGQVLLSADAGLVPQEVLSGTVFDDRNANGVRDMGELGAEGWLVFLDGDGDRQLDGNERLAITDSNGTYSFAGVLRGTQHPTLRVQEGWDLTWPIAPQYDTFVPIGGVGAGPDFGVVSSAAVPFVAPVSAATTLTMGNGSFDFRLASDDAGNYVIVREAYEGGGMYTVYIDLFDSAGNLRNSGILGSAVNPIRFDVAMDADGDFAVAYWLLAQSGLVYLQRYDIAGLPAGSAVAVGSVSDSDCWPSIAMDADGDAVVGWGYEGSFYIRRFDAASGPAGAAMRLNQYDVDLYWSGLQVDMNASGELIVAWPEERPEGFGVYGRLFDADGKPRGGRFVIDLDRETAIYPQAVAIGESGEFVALWQNRDQIQVQRFDAAAQPEGEPNRVATGWAVRRPALQIDRQGNYAIAWVEEIYYSEAGGGGPLSTYSGGLRLQVFNLAGQPQDRGMMVAASNSYGSIIASALVADDEGNLNVIWLADGQFDERRYFIADVPDPAIPGTAGSDCSMIRRAMKNVLVYSGPVMAGRAPASYSVALLNSLQVDGLAEADFLAVDFSGGVPVPAEGIRFVGGEGADTLNITGTHEFDALRVEPDRILHDDTRIDGPSLPVPIFYQETEEVVLGTAGYTMVLAHLSIAGGAGAMIPADSVLQVGGLSIEPGAILHLAGGLIVSNGEADAVEGLVKAGRIVGPGGEHARLIAILNQRPDGSPIMTEFEGVPVTAGDVLVRQTWEGDANLDGTLDADDYFRIDLGFLSRQAGWYSGDFNDDEVVSADDYTLIDLAFANRSGLLAASTPSRNAVVEFSLAPKVKKAEPEGILAQLFSTEPVV